MGPGRNRLLARKIGQNDRKVTDLSSFGEEYGQLIARRRESFGESQMETALAAFGDGSKKSRISELENGKVKRPQASTLAALNAHFDITEDELAACRRRGANTAETKRKAKELKAYVAQLESRLATQRAELETAHAEDAAILRAQIAELENRLRDPHAALQQAEATIAELRRTLEREENQLDPALEAEARQALDDKDFFKADAIFERIAERQELAIQQAARAHHARGEIAEEQVRWPDALAHYQRAASLHPCAAHFFKTGQLLWRLGRYPAALAEAQSHLAAAIAEDGEGSAAYAAALNQNALMRYELGQHAAAEPLYRQALTITKATLGEGHSDYATRLNNLAGLYRAKGRLSEAERLYRQASDIIRATLGEGHPTYATHLNNLAQLYSDMGRLSEAEPLLQQATAIATAALGPDHPTTKTLAANLAALKPPA